jgi:hypothetical protein
MKRLPDTKHFLKVFLCSYIFLAFGLKAFSQASIYSLPAVKTTLPIKIDGDLNDEAWKTAAVTRNFTEQRPHFGKKENEATKTEAFILYDDNAVYVAMFCHEQSRDSISTELVGRDRIGINDFAGVMFDTYMDKINGVGFYVTALGEQYDCKYSLNNEDDSWSTVYHSATAIRNDGWILEMRIPYSALRFSKENVQSWGINFVRRRTRTGQQFMWSPIDPNKFGTMNQAGVWEGIQDIRAPVRLSFSPYFSTYLNNSATATSDWRTTVNGGMDVKYGISKGFTLDMTLIPDFGQVQSDNQVLNLTPFEVRFNENRTFFTEGTELFNKGNLFYSRRIGGQPLNYFLPYDRAGAGETVVKNPSETKLLNATKISGRTAGGLGIGFFNAITKPQHALIENSDKEQYKIETNPLTNYNIVVLDQTLKNNSSVTLVNTNVLRNGKDYDANVTAALWDIYDNNVDWNFWGKVANSRLFDHPSAGKNLSGYNYELNFGKFRGPFNFEIDHHVADDTYQQNDLGYFTNNNYFNYGLGAWYKIVKPKSFYNNIYVNFRANYSQRYRPRSFQYVSVSLNANSQLKNLWTVGLNSNVNPEQQDFYEPRKEGKLFKNPASYRIGFFIKTNSAKKYAASVQLYQRRSPRYASDGTQLFLGNQYRFNDKLSVSLNNNLDFIKADAGFAFMSSTGDSVIFGLRNHTTVENIFNVKYNFNIRMGITFRARHYWSKVHYFRFFNLRDDGYLDPVFSAGQNPDKNLNLFNIDAVYTWQFAPGSFINIAWKDAAQLFNQAIEDRYPSNFSHVIKAPQENNFSIKVIYYLDYLSLRRGR